MRGLRGNVDDSSVGGEMRNYVLTHLSLNERYFSSLVGSFGAVREERLNSNCETNRCHKRRRKGRTLVLGQNPRHTRKRKREVRYAENVIKNIPPSRPNNSLSMSSQHVKAHLAPQLGRKRQRC